MENASVKNLQNLIDENIKLISQCFEIRLNPTKSQDIFNNNKMIDYIKEKINALECIDINMYKISVEYNDIIYKTFIIYYNMKESSFYEFQIGHFNINLSLDNKIYTCKINDMNIYDNTITLCCRDIISHLEELKILSINIFIDKIDNIQSYKTNMLQIFC